jgi:hypothetical protein
MINEVYTISGVRCCDHVLSAGFVTNKKDCGLLAFKHFNETTGEAGKVTVDTEHDQVTIVEECKWVGVESFIHT